MNKKLTQTAVLAGICILLTATGLGLIKTPLLSVTILHLPVILGVLLVGKKEGVILGLTMGLCSLADHLLRPTAISFVFYNPMVSIFPRVMIPIMVILASKLTRNMKRDTRVIISGLVGSITNTVFVLGMIYLLYSVRYAEVLGVAHNAVFGVIMTTVFTNGIAEAIVVTLFTLLIIRAFKNKELEV